MRAVVQRVRDARVEVGEKVVGSIASGLLVYLAVRRGDVEADGRYLARKVLDLRIFPDSAGKMNRSLLELRADSRSGDGEPPGILVVSQFTLYGDVRKGRRPSYNDAAPPDDAKRLYETFLTALANNNVTPQSGVFREHMDVIYTNDGPVTILMNTERDQ
ncbi:MAG: D-tyrosyl-tRNA(Tyr) deacylase [Spirochaetaceae bacterium]|nr:D-tyrosyl-tRNA(Tyr) deacylase [Spirochaetaceae bacterium]